MIDKKKVKLVNYSAMAGIALGVVSFSTFAKTNEASAMIGNSFSSVVKSLTGTSSQVTRWSDGIVYGSRVVTSPSSSDPKVKIPGNYNYNPDTKIVSLVNTDGQKVKYVEEGKVAKLTASPEQLIKERYYDEYGSLKTYVGLKDSKLSEIDLFDVNKLSAGSGSGSGSGGGKPPISPKPPTPQIVVTPPSLPAESPSIPPAPPLPPTAQKRSSVPTRPVAAPRTQTPSATSTPSTSTSTTTTAGTSTSSSSAFTATSTASTTSSTTTTPSPTTPGPLGAKPKQATGGEKASKSLPISTSTGDEKVTGFRDEGPQSLIVTSTSTSEKERPSLLPLDEEPKSLAFTPPSSPTESWTRPSSPTDEPQGLMFIPPTEGDSQAIKSPVGDEGPKSLAFWSLASEDKKPVIAEEGAKSLPITSTDGKTSKSYSRSRRIGRTTGEDPQSLIRQALENIRKHLDPLSDSESDV